jgi:hypothetical protein
MEIEHSQNGYLEASTAGWSHEQFGP